LKAANRELGKSKPCIVLLKERGKKGAILKAGDTLSKYKSII
jgi:hypothetical protein